MKCTKLNDSQLKISETKTVDTVVSRDWYEQRKIQLTEELQEVNDMLKVMDDKGVTKKGITEEIYPLTN